MGARANKCPRAWAAHAGGKLSRAHHNRADRRGQPDPGIVHAVATDQVERGLLSCGFHNPILLNNAAFLLGITVEHFTDPNHGDLFRLLIIFAQRGITPTVELVKGITESTGTVWHPNPGLADEALRRVVFVEGSAALTESYAGMLAEMHCRRARARALMHEARELLAADPWESQPGNVQAGGVVVPAGVRRRLRGATRG